MEYFSVLDKKHPFRTTRRFHTMCHHNNRLTFLVNRCKRFIRLSAAFESSAPEGSSARISCGFVISALAIAALCFCPPDTSYGYFSSSFSIPSFSAIGFNLFSISGYFFPDNTSGRNILSFNENVSNRLKA